MKILFVDDDTTALSTFEQVAQLENISRIDTAKSAERALGKVVTTPYDLITVDIAMPGMNGLEIIPLLRNMCPHAIIVIISGFVPPMIPNEVTTCIDGAFEKPITLKSLQHLIQSAHQVHSALIDIQAISQLSFQNALEQAHIKTFS